MMDQIKACRPLLYYSKEQHY